MKILLVHNFYIQWGGEDSAFKDEISMLKEHGHQTVSYTRDNHETQSFSLFQKIAFPFSLIFSLKTFREIGKLIDEEKPDLVHIHNIPVDNAAYRHMCLNSLDCCFQQSMVLD